jgi:hypothetical protein
VMLVETGRSEHRDARSNKMEGAEGADEIAPRSQ